jgi:hypothetical protein
LAVSVSSIGIEVVPRLSVLAVPSGRAERQWLIRL